MLLPTIPLARRAMPSRYIGEGGVSTHGPVEKVEQNEKKPFDLIGLGAALSVSMAICAVGNLLAGVLGMDNYLVLIITILALLVANFARPLVNRFSAEFDVGTFFMYVFFVTIGASADFASIAGVALPYVILICSAVVLFIVVIIGVGKVMKLDLAELMIAANACILGPATAAAMAAGQHWRDLVTPGMLAGILGYSTAIFVGVAITKILG